MDFFLSKTEKHKFLSSQLKTQNEHQGFSEGARRISLSCSHSAERDKNQAHSFILQIAELQNELNLQPSTVLR